MKKKTNIFKNYNYQQAVGYYQETEKSKNSWYIKILIFIVTTLSCTFFFSVHFDIDTDQSLQYRAVPEYMWTNHSVIAEYTFPVFKNFNEYKAEESKAGESALSVFTYDNSAKGKCLQQLDAIYYAINQYCNDSLESTPAILSENLVNEMENIPKSQCVTIVKKINTNLKTFVNFIYENGFINESIKTINQDAISVHIPPNKEKLYKKEFLTDISKISADAEKYLAKRLSSKTLPIALEIVSILDYPNFIYSKSLSEKYKIMARQSVARHQGIVRKGETIVSKGEIVSKKILNKLTSYGKSRLIKNEVIYSIWSFLGGIGQSILIYSILVLYLFFIRKKIFVDNFQIGILSSLLVFTAFLAWLSVSIPTKLPIEYLIFIPGLSMLAAVVFDSRTAFYVTVTMALMVSGIRGSDYHSGLILLFSGTLAAYTVRDIQNRTQMFQSILFIFLGFAFAIIAISLERSAEWSPTLDKLYMASLNSVISPLIAFGLLIVLERYSKITTDLRLQEYDKQNHTLLIKLNEIAPGTYQHTLSMSVLAERCAGAIGANPLLAKVGALYHDIGKTANPELFIENQLDNVDIHKQLSPKKSVEAIKQHVVEGIKLAHEYQLPDRIIDFIPTHHGTFLIKHFYAKALEEADDINEINEIDFRYPGPKPISKETAIVMICDFSEAISRLSDMNTEKLEKAIQDNIRERLLDGQFDQCNLTLKDLEIIKDTCLKSLIGSSHHRVKYKEIPKEKIK